ALEVEIGSVPARSLRPLSAVSVHKPGRAGAYRHSERPSIGEPPMKYRIAYPTSRNSKAGEGTMRCPISLRDVGGFTQAVSEDGGKSYTCPECKEAVPLLYAEDYAEYPPIVFSLVGLRGHGKTVYLASLLYEFERVGRQWRDFTFSPLDESGLTTVREKQKALE